MSTSTAYIDPRRLAALGGTKLRARAVVEGTLAGMHRNPNRGASVEFAEYKEYAPGDELKHIDWRAYARVDRYYVKQFEDETNLRAWFLVDHSGSMAFQYDEAPSKFMWAGTLAASLAWILIRQGDAPGIQLFAQEPGTALPPASRPSQLDDICAVLDGAALQGQTDLTLALTRLAERLRQRSLVVVLSDFIQEDEELWTMARVLRRRGNEVVFFHVMDRAEWTLPWENLTLFEGMEGEGDGVAEPDEIRRAYQQELGAHLERVEQECARGDIEYFRSFTDEPVEETLRKFLQGRERRGGRK